jgi:hypothetical protein
MIEAIAAIILTLLILWLVTKFKKAPEKPSDYDIDKYEKELLKEMEEKNNGVNS